jgi:predicted enzyme related to lactoylglutathione lyase
MADEKAELHRYLRQAGDALVWKLEGLPEYDVRRPLTPTGTNLLGIVKHVASVEAGSLGEVFGRPFPEPLPWFEPGAEPNADMWATADESREDVLGLFSRVRAHTDATIEALPLDTVGEVPWWPAERRQVTLHHMLVRLIAEEHRHAGQADVVRELVDGAAGAERGNENMPPGDDGWWARYRERVAAAAARFRPPEAPPAVRQLRLVVAAEDYDDAVRFYRDVLGLPAEGAFEAEGGAHVTILDAGRATLEIANPAQRRFIDDVEVGRPVAPRLRVAFEVDDTQAVTGRLAGAGAAVVAPPTETPWRSLNARLDAPAGLHITVFQELDPPAG